MKGGALHRIALGAVVIPALGALMPVITQAATMYSFQTLDNPADVTFNQLLGVDTAGTIAGYFGVGSATHPDKG